MLSIAVTSRTTTETGHSVFFFFFFSRMNHRL
nr:MAG TPA: hypothetical protein [Caudoviricetes sp.]